jgi:hypothetical protein
MEGDGESDGVELDGMGDEVREQDGGLKPEYSSPSDDVERR